MLHPNPTSRMEDLQNPADVDILPGFWLRYLPVRLFNCTFFSHGKCVHTESSRSVDERDSAKSKFTTGSGVGS